MAYRVIQWATGGIGRAFKITSNSWEYTGDGHALAFDAGAELIDMEFVQFHPTGMVWPPSVRGILVTEGVRGEGGVLKNTDDKRFMFEDIPDLYCNLNWLGSSLSNGKAILKEQLPPINAKKKRSKRPAPQAVQYPMMPDIKG